MIINGLNPLSLLKEDQFKEINVRVTNSRWESFEYILKYRRNCLYIITYYQSYYLRRFPRAFRMRFDHVERHVGWESDVKTDQPQGSPRRSRAVAVTPGGGDHRHLQSLTHPVDGDVASEGGTGVVLGLRVAPWEDST